MLNYGSLSLHTSTAIVRKRRTCEFFWLPAAGVRVPGCSPFTATTTRKGQFHVREKQQIFFWTDAALIITIVAVIVPEPESKLSWVNKRKTTERLWTAEPQTNDKTSSPQQTNTKTQNLSKTDHGEKMKQAQALTYVCNSPRLSLPLQQEIVKVHCKDWLLCARRSILDLLPLFHSAS